MQKVNLEQVLELLINEEHEEASNLLHTWFVGKSKEIHESLMQEDDDILEDERLQDIQDDKDEIESEEYFGEDDLGDEDSDVIDGEEEVAGDEVEGDIDGEEAADDIAAELGADDEAGEEAVEDKVEDLEAQLADLKAEFEKLMGGEEEAAGEFGDDEAGDEFGGDEVVADLDEPAEESFAFESEEVSEDEEAVEESEEVSEDEEVVSEDEDFDDLTESFELEAVADPNLSGDKEVGDDGDKIAVNDVSPIPQKKGADRVGGKPVEIKAKEHKGYEREASPEVKSKPLLKNQVKNAKADLTSVSKEGDKSAVLNKKDGFGSDSPKSPIGAGAADLRGSDFKRK